MTEIIAEAGRITGPVTETNSKIVFGVQSAYAKAVGQRPIRFVASDTQMAGLSEGDLIIVRFSRPGHIAVAGPLPVASLSLA